MLLHIYDSVILRNYNETGIRLFLSGYQPEKGRFAMTVLTNQTHALPRAEGKADPIEDEVSTEAFCQIFYSDHIVFPKAD